MFGFTDWFSGIVTYVMSWYEKFDISDSDSEEEWGQFVIIDEEKI